MNVIRTFLSLTLGGFCIMLFSCQSEQLDFCQRYELDQLRDYKGDDRNALRMQHIRNNWDYFHDLVAKDALRSYRNDSCFQKFVSITMTHVAQNFPNEFFDKSFVDQVTIYKDEGLIESVAFGLSLDMVKQNDYLSYPLCKRMKPKIDYALVKWKSLEDPRNPVDAGDFVYEDCE